MSVGKAIALLDSFPKIEQQLSFIQSREKFYEKQIETIREREQEEMKCLWNTIDEILRKADAFPPEYSRETHCISINKRDNVIRIATHEEIQNDGMPNFLKAILRKD